MVKRSLHCEGRLMKFQGLTESEDMQHSSDNLLSAPGTPPS